jgi:hypothetical protein
MAAIRSTKTSAGASHRRFGALSAAATGVASGPEILDSVSKANAKSRADSNRCSGFFPRQWRRTRSSAGGIGALMSFVISGGSVFRIALMVSRPYRPQTRDGRRASRREPHERKDVGAMIGLPAADLFRRHITYRAYGYAGIGGWSGGQVGTHRVAEGLIELGQAEIENLDAAVGGYETLAGLRSR